jgi:hypothetical protein
VEKMPRQGLTDTIGGYQLGSNLAYCCVSERRDDVNSAEIFNVASISDCRIGPRAS